MKSKVTPIKRPDEKVSFLNKPAPNKEEKLRSSSHSINMRRSPQGGTETDDGSIDGIDHERTELDEIE